MTVSAPFTLASKEYMPKVGSLSMILSPGSMTSRKMRSMISSLPAPAMIRSAGTPVNSERAARTLRWNGSG